MQRRLLFNTVLWTGILTAGNALAAPSAAKTARPENNAGMHHFTIVAASTNHNKPATTTIAGTVTDEANLPLTGVSVLEKGTKNGTMTDAQGNFNIKVSGPGAVLVFKFIGYATKEITVGSQTRIKLSLVSENNALTEVVVTALGIKRDAKKLGYSSTQANVEELNENRTTNVMTSLEGKVAGLDISPPSAGAGASNRITLRGQSAFAGVGSSPLIVLNGLPFDQGANGANGAVGNNSQDKGDALSQINQDDIESINILKGATAAALYGSRASNGAIVITTKNGSKNTSFGVELNSSFSADQALDYNNFQTVYGQGLGGKKPVTIGDAIAGGGQNWGALNDGTPTIQFDGIMRPYQANPIHNRILQYYRTGNTVANTVALSAGSNATSYRMAFTNLDTKGITPYNDYHKKIFNLGLNSKLNNYLTTTFNVNYTHELNNNPPNVGLQGIGSPNFLYRMSNTIPLSAFQQSAVDPVGGYERVSSGFQSTLINPYYVQPRQFTIVKNDRILATGTLRYDASKWFYIQGRVNFDYGVGTSEGNTPSGVGSSTLRNGTNTGYNGNYNTNESFNTALNMDVLMGTGNHTFGDFSFEFTAGGNMNPYNGHSFNESVTDFNVLGLYTIGNGVTKSESYGIGRTQVNSVYGVADFGYKNFLYVNVTDRTDWFSVLSFPTSLVANGKNYYNYPSVSGSFVFSELLPKMSWLNYGKLRASYASVGSAAGIGAFSGQLTYNIASNNYVAANGNSYPLGSIANGSNPNPYIQPFGVTEKEIGLELRTLNSRLNFDIAAYDKETNKQIISVQISNSSGYTSTPLNLGQIQNRGLEMMLEVVPVKTPNISWSSAFNASFNTSKILALSPGVSRQVIVTHGGNEFIGSLDYQLGYAMNQIAARTYARDANGNIEVGANGRLIASSTDVLFGQADPKWIGGWNNTFRYKRLSLLAHIDYKLGNKILSSTALNALRQGESQASLVGRVGGVVFPAVYAPGTPNAGQPNTTAVDPQTFYTDYRTLQIADPFVFNGGFIKLRNVTLAYDLTGMLGRSVNKVIKGLSVSASCHNVLLIKKWIPDVDPEAFASSGDYELGYEQATIPTFRTYGLNLNVKL